MEWLKDWGPTITAGATVLVAVFTLLAARAARAAATAAEESTAVSREATDIARSATEATELAALYQSAPVVFGIDVRSTGGGRTDLRVEAVGSGVAYNVVATVTQDGATGHTPMLSPVVGGVGVSNRIDLLPVSFAIRPGVQYTVETTYGALGQEFRTIRESIPGGSGVFTGFERRRDASEAWQSLW